MLLPVRALAAVRQSNASPHHPDGKYPPECDRLIGEVRSTEGVHEDQRQLQVQHEKPVKVKIIYAVEYALEDFHRRVV